jgi:hypothetical protein
VLKRGVSPSLNNQLPSQTNKDWELRILEFERGRGEYRKSAEGEVKNERET